MKKIGRFALALVLVLNLAIASNSTSAYVTWYGAGLSLWNPSNNPQPTDIQITRDNFTSDCPSIAWDKAGFAHVSWWSDATGNREIYYVHWNGAAWVNAAGQVWNNATYNANVSQNAGASQYQILKLDSAGRPNLLWWDQTQNVHGLYFVRWNGTNWVTANGALYTGVNGNVALAGGAGTITNFKCYSFSLDSSNNPHIAFCDTISGNSELYYIKWDGSNWVNVKGLTFDNVTGANANVSNSTTDSKNPSISIGLDGTPHIAWQEVFSVTATNTYATLDYVYWGGASWVSRGGFSYNSSTRNADITVQSGYVAHPRMVVDKQNTVHILFAYENSFVNPISATHKFDIHYIKSLANSKSWKNAKGEDFDLGQMNSNVSNNGGYSYTYSPEPMVIDSNGYPHIVWEDNSYKNPDFASLDIYYLRWNGTAWVNDAGQTWNPITGNACVVNTTMESSCADIALDDKNQPVVAWEEDSYGGITEILSIQLQNYDMGYIFKKSVSINNAIAYNDDGKTAKVGDKLNYSMSLDINPNPLDPYAPYVFDKIPDGTTYISGSISPTIDLAYSNDNGTTWTAGEPPNESPAGTRLRWGPLWRDWVGMADSRYNPTLLQSQQPFDINVSRTQSLGRAFMCPSMDTDSNGNPNIVCWVPYGSATDQKIFFFRWSGTNWVSIDGQAYVPTSGSANAACVNPGPSTSAYPMMVLDNYDNPHIVWYERFSQAPIMNGVYYVRWKPGDGWVTADGSKYNSLLGNARLTNYACSSTTYPPSICNIDVDSYNNPHIVFERNSGGGTNSVCYTYWDGSQWKTGSGQVFNKDVPNADIFTATAGIYATVPRIDVDRENRPNIIWTENSSRELYYVYRSFGQWYCRDGSLFDPSNPLATNGRLSRTAGNTGWGEICTGTDGSIHVAWEETVSAGNSDIFYVKSDDNKWWNNAQGQPWDPVSLNANVTNDAGLSRYIFVGDKMALDYRNRPHIVWEDNFGNPAPVGNEVCYTRWNGSEWVNVRGEMHSQFLDNYNVSRSVGRESSCPSVAIDLKERPYMTWEEGNDVAPEPCQVYFLRRPEYNFKFSVRIDDPFDYSYTPVTNEGWICNAGDGNCLDAYKSNRVTNPVYKPSPSFLLQNIPDDMGVCTQDPINFTLTITNKGDLASTNTVCKYILPRELQYISSTPTMSVSQNTLIADLGTMNPGAKVVYKIFCKLDPKVQVTDSLNVITEAVLTYSELVGDAIKKPAFVKVSNCLERRPLLLYTEWKGINTKTSTGDVGQEISVSFKPEWYDHGVSPYDFIVDWGDGTQEKFFDKTGDNLLTSKHTYASSGEYSFWIKVDDSVARSYKVTRKLNIK